ncbi:MAG: transcription elongation factor GreAB [Rhizobiaceae bacterium]|nr:transcription elongation factor GreAB [Rhizobiaceae bacterium]
MRPLLTTKDIDILTAMLDRSSGDPAFLRLLRDKLNGATVHFPDDIPSDVVTLNSRVCYSVNGRQLGPHIIVQIEGDDLPPFALSIHAMRGLALLGLTVGEVRTIEYADGRHDVLAVEELIFQPEADRRFRDGRPFGRPAIRPAALEATSRGGLSRATPLPPGRRPVEIDEDSNGDDPGPQAP